ncbi:hypothetical protein OSB04_004695 [Centaurea solstitialis]|uniref:dCMP deaminase n=1 Tax=Centaurea solstitialis TaxID=347529 RepID=A0AA38WP15_9ASTR|nr:hypothetical protein OSB04_004695 [Centaurea solstitialis]
MNSRDLALISTAAIAGAVASAIAIRLLANPRKKPSSAAASNSAAVLRRNSSSGDPYDPSKRNGYLSWDDYFMAIAFLSAERSKDPNRQYLLYFFTKWEPNDFPNTWRILSPKPVRDKLRSGMGVHLLSMCKRRKVDVKVLMVGACLVSQDGIILGIGYNGFPRGCSDDKLPWSKKSKNGDPLETKYPYVCHAEVNCILNTNHASAAGQKLYVTMFPCNECAKVIIQSGVSEVIYFVEKSLDNSNVIYVASHKLLSMAGIKVSYTYGFFPIFEHLFCIAPSPKQ